MNDKISYTPEYPLETIAYFMKNNEIIEGTVHQINIGIYSKTSVHFKYNLRHGHGYSADDMPESSLYSSKKKLIEFLMRSDSI